MSKLFNTFYIEIILMSKIIPNSWNGWDPLKTCMLGTSVPDNYFSSIRDVKLRDSMNRIVNETNEDLENFKNVLEKQGVEVVRAHNPVFIKDTFHQSIDFLEDQTNGDKSWKQILNKVGVFKPSLTPRDWMIVMGDKLLHTFNTKHTFLKTLEVIDFDHAIMSDRHFDAPYLTRFGDAVIIDELDQPDITDFMEKTFPDWKQIHCKEGGHSDGMFSPVKPGHVISIADETINLYNDTLPNWEIFYTETWKKPEFKKWEHNKNFGHGKAWWSDDMHENPAMFDLVQTWLDDWVGYFTETVFEVNMLTINPRLVAGSVRNAELEKHLEKIDMEFLHIPFRHRRFWDGGLHCLTVDLVRESSKQNYGL
ncbi:MAG: hypothetical protein ACR2MS_06055 [Weeksellaceae bacterium]